MPNTLFAILSAIAVLLLVTGFVVLVRAPERLTRVRGELWGYGLMLAGASAVIIALWVGDVGRSVDKAMPTETFIVVLPVVIVSMCVIARRARRARKEEGK